ncbi:MAG: hypothetical protein BGO98_24065 [Myxococcales bacterium 68-20]|nr:MAG: hypothetical protein BGO98_24065 [Myxococcales bacterium 68-20]
MIHWTAESQALVYPTRAEPNASYLPSVLKAVSSRNPLTWPFDVAQAWTGARAWDHRREIERAQNGLGSATTELRAVMERAIAERQRTSPPDEALDVDVEAATVALDIAHTWSIVPYWIAKQGVPFALEALVRAHALEPSHNKHGYGSGKIWLEESWDHSARLDSGTGWNILRGCLAVADAPLYDEARRVANRLRPSLPLGIRSAVAFAFPDERAWVAEAAQAVFDEPQRWHGDIRRLVATADLETAERLADSMELYFDETFLFTVLARHGAAGARVIGAAMTAAPNNDLRKRHAKVLVNVAAESAAAILAGWLENKAVAPLARKYFAAHPELARGALENLASGAGSLARMATIELETLTTTSSPKRGKAKPDKSKPESAKQRKAPEKLDEGAPPTRHCESAPVGLPPVLVAPPWLAERPKPIVIEGLKALPFEPRILWRAGELEALQKDAAQWEQARTAREEWTNASTDELLAKWVERQSGLPLFWIGRITDTQLALELWDRLPPSKWWSGTDRAYPTILAQHGLAALPTLRKFAASRASEAVHGLAKVLSPETAEAFADIRMRLTSTRSVTDSWLVEHAEVTAIGLVPLAVGTPGPTRTAAEAALLLLRQRGRGELVDAVAARYGADVARAVAAIDPLLLLPKKMPKLPPFAKASALPPLELRAGGTVPEDAAEHFLMMLALNDTAMPYAGLAQVREACTPASLRDFAWALFERWLAAGAPPLEVWALRALGELGDDEIASRLAAKIRVWPKERALARASVGLDVLARIGSDIALMHVDRLAQGFRFASVREKAQEIIQRIASQRGLSAEELEDRLTPTLGLETDGSKVFDFGGRSFRVGFDEHLLPVVRADDGRVLADLPKATKSDDTAQAKAAHAAWKALKSDAKAVAARQIARFEQAMCNERAWRMPDFDCFIRSHPLVAHLARRLVWAIETTEGQGSRTLVRIAEDGTLADAADVAVASSNDARIGIVHPLRLNEAEVSRWGQVLADYEIVQPFDQLARRTFPLSDETGAGVTLEAGYVRGLRERGWAADGDSWVNVLTKSIAGGDQAPGGVVVVGFEPGYSVSDGVSKPQEIVSVSLQLGKENAGLSKLGPIAYSELRRELAG